MWTKEHRQRQAAFERRRYPSDLTDAELERIQPRFLYQRVPKLFADLALARGDDRHVRIMRTLTGAQLNGLYPQLYIADLLAHIGDHPARRIADLLPWNWKPAANRLAA